MASVSNILLDKEILLESGTNELEILVFNVADLRFGINVAKVREVLPKQPITSLPKAHSSVRGVFRLREHVIPCVSLIEHLGIEPNSDDSESTLILSDFNQQQTAFLVDSVERIYRLSWKEILAVPGIASLAKTPVTALARCEGRLIVMLDFEMIIDQVTNSSFRVGMVANPHNLPREELKLLLADDSPTVRQAITSTLRASGYTNLQVFENGDEAWKWIDDRYRSTQSLAEVGDLLISDVEMPQIDGLHLTKKIKSHPVLKELPVMLYSSIVTPDNKKKGQAVGADAQISKPELNKVVELADQLIVNVRAAKNGRRDNKSEAISGTKSATLPTPEECSTSTPPDSPKTEAAPVVDREENKSVAIQPSDGLRATGDNVPAGVDQNLWATFCTELHDRMQDLRQLVDRIGTESINDAQIVELLRLLHSVKSAAMVVPVDEVTRATHLAESLVDSWRQNPQDWQPQAFDGYVDVLKRLASRDDDCREVLHAAASLEADLAIRLAAVAN